MTFGIVVSNIVVEKHDQSFSSHPSLYPWFVRPCKRVAFSAEGIS